MHSKTSPLLSSAGAAERSMSVPQARYVSHATTVMFGIASPWLWRSHPLVDFSIVEVFGPTQQFVTSEVVCNTADTRHAQSKKELPYVMLHLGGHVSFAPPIQESRRATACLQLVTVALRRIRIYDSILASQLELVIHQCNISKSTKMLLGSK